MAPAPPPPRLRAVRRSRRRRPRLVPDGAGEGGFLLLPPLLAAAASGWSVDAALVAAALVALVPFGRALAGRLTAPRARERFDRPLAAWSSVVVPLMGVVVLRMPWMAAVAALYGVLYAVNLAYARQRRALSLGNDLVFVVECTLAVPVLAAAAAGDHRGGTPPWAWAFERDVLVATLVCALALTGSALHLRSMTQERHDPSYVRVSRVVALLSLVVVAGVSVGTGIGPVLAMPFVLLAARATSAPGWDWGPRRARRLALVDLGFLAVVVGAGFLALGPGVP